MKKEIIVRFFIILLCLVAYLADNLYAENKISIGVTCTVPAIPGVNVPLTDKNESRPEAAKPIPQENIKANKGNEFDNKLIQEERLVKNQTNQDAVIQTVYNR